MENNKREGEKELSGTEAAAAAAAAFFRPLYKNPFIYPTTIVIVEM